MITETNVEVLKSRLSKGLTYCSGFWHQSVSMDEPELQSQLKTLDKHTKTLRELTIMLRYQGFTNCVFGQCRWNENDFICLVCSKV